MSGWENVPEEKPPAVAPSPAATSDVAEAAPAEPKAPFEDGEMVRAVEWYFPALWIGMLAVCCFIGIYSAVGKLPNSLW